MTKHKQKKVGSALRFIANLKFLSAKRRFELYPPIFLMGAKVLKMDEGWNHVRLLLPLNWRSANSGGNMFGGYQASLADPIPALACCREFPGYRIVTKSLQIDFIRPGNSDLELRFDFNQTQKEIIRKELKAKGQADPAFTLAYYRKDGKVCTEILNTVAIRRYMV